MQPRPTPIALLLTLAAFAILVLPATAPAIPEIGEKDNGLSKLDERYLAVYKDCWEAFGADCGRNRVDDGNEDGTQPTDAQVAASTERMELWLNPPEPEPVAEPVTESVAPAPVETSVATDSGGYSIPSDIVMCESGGDYSASNPSGAYGAYQIMPGTASAYGCDLSTASGQDQCAAEIYADVGSSAWVCG